jgi:hypothetical protein
MPVALDICRCASHSSSNGVVSAPLAMSVTVNPPMVESPEDGVIDDARARQRRHRGTAGVAAALVAAAVVAAVIGFGAGRAGPSQHGGGPTPSAATPALVPFEESSSNSGTVLLTRKGSTPPASVTVGGVTLRAGERTSSTVRVSAPLGSSNVWQATIAVSHTCGHGATSCIWRGEASQSAQNRCPLRFNAAHTIWTGTVQRAAGMAHATVTFQLAPGVTTPAVCVYAQSPR